MNNDEWLDFHSKEGYNRNLLKWLLAYFRAANVDISLFDIQTIDKALSLREIKDLIRTQYPISNIDKLAKEEASKLQIEHANKEATTNYITEVKQHEAEQLITIRENPNTTELNRFANTLKVLVKTVANKHAPALFILSKEAGIGKTHNCISAINEAGLSPETDYNIFSSYSTPLSLYSWLFENRNKKVLILDDLDLALQNKIILTILKSATFNISGQRKIQYLSSWLVKNMPDIPQEFILEAGLILIANEKPNNIITSALVNRCLYYEISPNHAEKKRLIADLSKLPFKTTTEQQRKDALNFLLDDDLESEALIDFSFRTYQHILNIMIANPENWQEIAKSILTYDERILAFIEADKEASVKDAILKFEELTGLSRRSFFNAKIKYYNSLGISQLKG